jgi:oxaloacetate decarboxylase
MNPTQRRASLRAILASDRCFHPASVFDPMTMRMAEDLGFETAMLAGSVASMTILGAPDEAIITLTEFAEQVRRICRGGSVPLIVDADHGYGNALSVQRTVEELETAGVAALTIEDTRLPRSYGQGDKAELVTIAEGVGKMKAALAARQDPQLVIVGRTSSPAITGFADAVERCSAYRDAGVDAIFVNGIASREELESFCRAVALPVMIGNVGAKFNDIAFLGKAGVRIALQGHLPHLASVHAAFETMKALREGASAATIATSYPSDLAERLTRRRRYESAFSAFLGAPPKSG